MDTNEKCEKMRIKVTGYAYIPIPPELKGKTFEEIEMALQDDISNIDCGELENIDSECDNIE